MALNDSDKATPGASPGGYRPALFPTLLYGLGMAGVFIGERVLDVGTARNVAVLVGVALLLGALAARAVRQGTVPTGYRVPERALLALYVIGIVAVGLYFLNSDLLVRLGGKSLERTLPRVSGALSALWPALWLCGSLPVLFVELSLWSMAKAPVIELGRVRAALLSGLGIAFALVFAFGASYVASERDVRADFSYFRTSRPGESTRKIVQALDKPVAVHLFFPPANEVREEVEAYFGELSRLSRQLQVQRWDQALHPAKARELGVSANGSIVIARDALKETLTLPLELDRARGQLKNLDQDVQKRLLGVTRKQKVAYFTAGHEERTHENKGGDHAQAATIRLLRNLLIDQNFEPKELGLAQGLGNEVPADASLVLIIGPRQPFQPAEIQALLRYLDKNGRLLVALDPDAGLTMAELLAPLSLKYNPVTLATDKMYMALTYQDSDRINIGTSSYSSHVSVTTLSRLGAGAPVLMMGAGSLGKTEKTAAGIVNVDFTVRSDAATWADANGDFKFNEGSEVRTVFELAAAVTKRNASAISPEEEARAVVLADSDVLGDMALRHRPNQFLLVDTLRWLGGEERIAGAISSEEDVPISHTRKQNVFWFYLSVILVPAGVLGLGLVMTRKRRGARQKPASPPGGSGAGAPAADPQTTTSATTSAPAPEGSK